MLEELEPLELVEELEGSLELVAELVAELVSELVAELEGSLELVAELEGSSELVASEVVLSSLDVGLLVIWLEVDEVFELELGLMTI